MRFKRWERIKKSFIFGPPCDWTPAVGEKVAAYFGANQNEIFIEIGIIRGIYDYQHYSGNKITSYNIQFANRARFIFSRNNLRPA